MRVHFVVHEAFEAPGAFVDWVAARGFTSAWSRVYLGEPLPASPAGIDLLVVLGGPQSPTTSPAECPHFDSRAEQRLIADCVAAGKAVVGVCLGAQLIGAALGAPALPSPEKEIGKFPIVLTADGLRNDKFRHFGATLAVGHWHSDMPGLTPKATVIAASEGCPRQIVEYAPLVVGLQCHLEFTPAVIEGLIAAETALPGWQHHRFVESTDALRRHDFDAANAALFGLLDRLVLACRESGAASCGKADVMARTPRRSDRAIATDEAAALLDEGLYGVLSTVGPDGLPYGVPLSYIVGDDAIYFHCANAGRKLEHLDGRPEVSFCVVGKVRTLPRQFATEYESVIVTGRARRVEGEEKRQALVGILEKYSPAFMTEGQKYLTAKIDAVTVLRIDIEAISGKARR